MCHELLRKKEKQQIGTTVEIRLQLGSAIAAMILAKLPRVVVAYLFVCSNISMYVSSQSTVGEFGTAKYRHSCKTDGGCQYTLTLPDCQKGPGVECPARNDDDLAAMLQGVTQKIDRLSQKVMRLSTQIQGMSRCAEWELVFKAVSGVGGSVYGLWTDENGGRNQDNDQAKELNADFPDHYKSAKVDQWADQGIKQVKVSIYSGGKETMYMTFDGEGSDKNNWFSKARLIDTSYSDLNSNTTTNFFSIAGDNQWSRTFFVNAFYGGCGNDVGWLVVVDTSRRICNWMYLQTRPYFLYGKTGNMVIYGRDSSDIGDVLAIFVKT